MLHVSVPEQAKFKWSSQSMCYIHVKGLLQVVTLHVLCARAEPRPSLDLIPAPQCRTPKPVDDTAAGDLLSLARCSETGVNVVALLLYFDDFLCHAVKPH